MTESPPDKSIRIVCQEDESQFIQVSAKDSTETLLEKSDYFRVMFEHECIEAGTRTIRKPEWTHLRKGCNGNVCYGN